MMVKAVYKSEYMCCTSTIIAPVSIIYTKSNNSSDKIKVYIMIGNSNINQL